METTTSLLQSPPWLLKKALEPLNVLLRAFYPEEGAREEGRQRAILSVRRKETGLLRRGWRRGRPVDIVRCPLLPSVAPPLRRARRIKEHYKSSG